MLIFVYIFPESSTVKSVKFLFKLKTIHNTRACVVFCRRNVSDNKIALFITWQKFLHENLPACFKIVYTKFCFIH